MFPTLIGQSRKRKGLRKAFCSGVPMDRTFGGTIQTPYSGSYEDSVKYHSTPGRSGLYIHTVNEDIRIPMGRAWDVT